MKADPAVIYASAARRRCLEICREIVQEIRREPQTPVETSRMKLGYKAIPSGLGAQIVNPVEYWRFQEFGTEYMQANPHVRPAIEIVRGRHT